MARFSLLKNRFNLGEFGKRAFGLSNLEEYALGAAEVKNMIPLSTGGVRRRDGTRFLLSSTGYYQFADHANYGGLTASAALSGYYKLIGTDTSFGSFVVGVVQRDAPALPGFFVRKVDWTNEGYTLGTIATATFRTQSAGTIGNSDDLITGFGTVGPTNADLLRMKTISVGDVLYMVAPNLPPSFIAFTAADKIDTANIFSLYGTAFTTKLSHRVPYRTNVDSSLTLDPDNSDGVTAGSLNTVVSNGAFFNAAMAGQTILRLHGGSALVVTVNSSTSAECRVHETLSSTAATSSWEESEWSDYRGWPTEIAYFESRLYYFRKDTFWASQLNDVTQMSENVGASVTASSPYSFSFNIGAGESIVWTSVGENLTFGTTRGEYSVSGTNSSQALSATNFGVKKNTDNGSYAGAPTARIDNALFFVDREGDQVREFVFDERENAFRTKNISKLNFGMFRKTIEARQEDTAYDFADGAFGLSNSYQLRTPLRIFAMEKQVDQDNIVWMVDNYGGLSSLTVDRISGTYGFSRHVLGGSLDNNDTPKVHSIAVTDDRLFLFVERTINDADVTYLEVIPKQFLSNVVDPAFISGVGFSEDNLVYTDSTTFDSNNGGDILIHNALTHLEGETVSIVSDGRYVGTQAVASSAVTITRDTVIMSAGLAYESLVKLLPTEAGAQLGTSQGTKKRTNEATIRFNRTVAASVGIEDGTTQFDDITFRTAGMLLSAAIPLFNGLKDVQIPYTEEEQQLVIKTSKPLPMEVTAIVLKGMTNEG